MSVSRVQPLRVDLVFTGQVLAGFDREQVKRAIGDFFKLDELRRDRMFSGAPQVIKRGLAPEDASRYIALFEKMGGRLQAHGDGVPAAAVAAEAPVMPAAPLAREAPPAAAKPGPRTPPSSPVVAASTVAAPTAPALELLPVQPSPAPAPEARPRSDASSRRLRDDDDDPPIAAMVVVEAPPPVLGIGLAGRLARRPYGAAALFGWAAMRWAVAGLLHHPRPIVAVLIGLGLLVAALWTFRLTILRLHDIGLPGWWVLLGAVPIVGTLAGVLLAMVPGSHGDNRFGAEPDPGSPILRLVVTVAVLVIGAGFRHGLMVDALGPGSGAAALQNASPADAAAQALSDDELATMIKSPSARHDFREGYWPARGHKAFASSDSGPWGWSGDAGTADAARAQALDACERKRDAYSSECKTVHVDGEWAD